MCMESPRWAAAGLTKDLKMNKIEELALAMIDYNNGDPKRISYYNNKTTYDKQI